MDGIYTEEQNMKKAKIYDSISLICEMIFAWLATTTVLIFHIGSKFIALILGIICIILIITMLYCHIKYKEAVCE